MSAGAQNDRESGHVPPYNDHPHVERVENPRVRPGYSF